MTHKALDIRSLQCLLLCDSAEHAATLRSNPTIQELLRRHNFTRIEIVSPMVVETTFDTKARVRRVISTELRCAFNDDVWQFLCSEGSVVQIGAMMAIKHGLRILFWLEADVNNRRYAWTFFINTRVVTADAETIACF